LGPQLDGAALPRPAPDARRVRAGDAPRRPGHLSQGSSDDPLLGRRLPRVPRARGRHRLGRPDPGAPARGRPRRPSHHLRAARRVRAPRAGEHPHASGRGRQSHGPAAAGRGRPARRGPGRPDRVRPARALEAHRARRAGAAAGRDLPLLRADDRAVAADRRGAPARAALGARRDLRDPVPAVEHRRPVGATVPPHGRPHRIHHGRAAGRAGRERRARRAAQPSPARRRRALMIAVMRRYRKSLQIGLLVVIAAFVASLFVFGSSGSRMGGGEARDRVATVNGESIPIERFQRRYQSYLEAYAQMYRDRFTNELAERLGLPLQVVGDLVQEALIVQRAQAEGLAVTDEELNARIHAIPGFQENGRFSLKRYQEILKRRGFNPAAFEVEIRRELTRAKVESAVRSGVKVSETELEQAFRMRREEVRAAWALVELAPMVAAASATDEELATYLASHPDEFRQPDRRRVQY